MVPHDRLWARPWDERTLMSGFFFFFITKGSERTELIDTGDDTTCRLTPSMSIRRKLRLQGAHESPLEACQVYTVSCLFVVG